jgi:hypothetical protein
MNNTSEKPLRQCLREPIPEIYLGAQLLAQAAEAHLAGQGDAALDLLRRANIPAIREWTESLWGKRGAYAVRGPYDSAVPVQRAAQARMPSKAVQHQLHASNGFYCRFCGIPVIRSEVREFFRAAYPAARIWGRRNVDQHAAFQCMWAQYDHVLPHSRGGSNDLDNLVVTCAPCNYGRMQYTLAEAGLDDPRTRPPKVGTWTGLEEVLTRALG